MQPTGKRPLSDLKREAIEATPAYIGPVTVEPPGAVPETLADKALNAVRNPAGALTTQDAYDKRSGWKPLDVNGAPAEYQIRPAKTDPACTVTTVRQKTDPRKIIASSFTCG